MSKLENIPQRSITISLDIDNIDKIKNIVEETSNQVFAYKIGTQTCLRHGIHKISSIIKDSISVDKTKNFPYIIADFQKFGSDIPKQADDVVPILRDYVDAVIVFPHAGPMTQISWMEALEDADLECIIGGEMTHPCFLQEDNNGYIRNGAPVDIFDLAIARDIRSFVLPGNKPEKIKYYRKFIEDMTKDDNKELFYLSPGLLTQGGDLTESGKAVGNQKFSAIIGRAVLESPKPGKTVDWILEKLK